MIEAIGEHVKLCSAVERLVRCTWVSLAGGLLEIRISALVDRLL